MAQTPVEPQFPKRISDADLVPRGRVFPSPEDWRDELLYFLLPDRFSDGNEGGRPKFDPHTPAAFRVADKKAWMAAGKGFQGGTLKGIRSKLTYLRDLGVTALWIGPVWKQRPDLDTYHGYGIQNFLEIDPRFGTRQDLRDLVDAAHDLGMYVLLDVIYNHSGDNFYYDDNGAARSEMPYRFSPPYMVHGWHSAAGLSVAAPATAEDGVWPEEFQALESYTRAGRIGRWDPEPWEDPMHPDNEFRRGDFYGLKNLELQGRTLSNIMDAYRYWIALSDCDGFRIDTVKHVPFEASRNFCGGVREYAESIGKQNFLLLGEVTGGAGMTRRHLDIFGRNLDAALDIGDPAERLARMVKGFGAPQDFFVQFGGCDDLGSHREVGRYHISILDDHDMVARAKRRFSAGNAIPARCEQVAHAVGTMMTTLGVPCVYYGTEQAFDGNDGGHDAAIEPLDGSGNVPSADRYIRETMFGGTFGAFETAGCHFFDCTHPAYLRIAAIARVRNRSDAIGLALRRGRQYVRETAFPGWPFAVPGAQELAAWSRILFRQEVLVCLNTHGTQPRGAEVTVDADLHAKGSKMNVLYRSDWTDAQLQNPPAGETADVDVVDGRARVRVDLPPAGMTILA
jgi:glycosidase